MNPVVGRSRPVALRDRGVVVLAVAAGAGAYRPAGVPPLVPVLGIAVALVFRRPVLVVVATALLASALAARSMAGLEPVPAGPFRGPVTLVSDPSSTAFGVRADVRVDGRRLELEASGAPAGSVAAALAGERLIVEGRLRPPPPDAPWLVPRHVVGRLAVTRAERADAGAAPWRAANRARRLLARGAAATAPGTRSLYLAFVVGDDRELRPEVVDDFRGAGLSHVLVVSGQNLAFVVALLGPLLRRLRLGARTTLLLAVIAAFALVTRFEPSVLRASAMATVSVTAAFAGRPASAVRRLALAVTGLVLVDPLLVRAVGFQLSVAACAGIALLGRPIAERVRGPSVVGETVGASVAAQVGVAPVLIGRFGGVPVAGLVANPLAVPVAGLVTTWGLPAGVLAGLAGPGAGRWLHLPTGLLVGWVAAVARVTAALPLGEIRAREAVALAALGGLWVLFDRRADASSRGPEGGPSAPALDGPAAAVHQGLLGAPGPRPVERPVVEWGARRAVAAAMAVVLLAPALALRWPPAEVHPLGGVTVRRSAAATTVEVRGRPDPSRLMEALRRSGVRRIDLLRLDRPDDELVRVLRHRWVVARIAPTAPD